MNTVEKKVLEYRKANPSSRAQGPFVLAKNTNATKQKKCIFCGEHGPTWASSYPQTKRAKAWEEVHLQAHVAQWDCSETHGSATSGRELRAVP